MFLKYRAIFLTFVVLALVLAGEARAAVVGAFSQVEGKVDILRQGKLPGVSARVQDQVEAGDFIRTKSRSRAQVRFVDDTVLTIAPGSLVAIDAYLFDAAQSRRQAVLQVFRGLVHCVVNRLYKLEEPDFLIKTFTANMGVRGTRWFTLVGVKFVGGFVEEGMVEMSSVLTHLLKKVLIVSGEYSFTPFHREPMDVRRYSLETIDLLRQWLITGVPERILQSDPATLQWEGGSGLQLLPPGLGKPGQPKELPEGLFIPPALKPPVQAPCQTRETSPW